MERVRTHRGYAHDMAQLSEAERACRPYRIGAPEMLELCDALIERDSALDALREAVKGCGKRLDALSMCDDSQTGWLCYGCQLKRDAAIARILGESEGDGNGR